MTPNHTQNSVPVDPNRKKLVWKEAATGGLYLGLALVAVMVISYLGRMDATLSWVPGLLNFAALVLFILFYARKVSHYYASTGFYYPQSLAFILKMMLFAGVLAGVGQFILQNYVDPGYYTSVIETTLKESGFKEEDISLTMETGVMRNPIVTERRNQHAALRRHDRARRIGIRQTAAGSSRTQAGTGPVRFKSW